MEVGRRLRSACPALSITVCNLANKDFRFGFPLLSQQTKLFVNLTCITADCPMQKERHDSPPFQYKQRLMTIDDELPYASETVSPDVPGTYGGQKPVPLKKFVQIFLDYESLTINSITNIDGTGLL